MFTLDDIKNIKNIKNNISPILSQSSIKYSSKNQLDKILEKTKIKLISDEKIAEITKKFHNENNNNDANFLREIQKNKINQNIEKLENYLYMDDLTNLKKGMFIRILNKKSKSIYDYEVVKLRKENNNIVGIKLYYPPTKETLNINIDDYMIFMYDGNIKNNNTLEKYYYIDNINYLNVNDWIKYINKKNRGKISSGAKIIKINTKKYTDENNVSSNIIKNFVLYNFFKKIKWTINPHNYYIYKYDAHQEFIDGYNNDNVGDILKKISGKKIE
jgi:hypothetical protein